MHNQSFDLSLKEISKIEGTAGIDVKVTDGKVEDVKLKLTDYRRFYTNAVRGKPVNAVPQLVARICGTCSNAHLLASLKAIELGLNITPSPQTQLMRRLLTNGLMIRDHGLHLYVFALPDVLGKDSILDFDEANPHEHQLLHDTFTVKQAGNQLSVAFGGRSVHAPYPTIGGFTHFPSNQDIKISIKQLEEARPAALFLIKVFTNCSFNQEDKTLYVSLTHDHYDFLDGLVTTSTSLKISPSEARPHLNRIDIPYSQGASYTWDNQAFMVGALSRINLAKTKLHPSTQRDAASALNFFPSTNIFHNNLAQAIEILHCLDDSLDILRSQTFSPEPLAQSSQAEGQGTGIIEAPRGLLYHAYDIKDRLVTKAEIIVPTGQNQLSMEKNARQVVEKNLDQEKEIIALELEKCIRAYDPCISCATHFLKIRWL
ncbi:hypothetical protein A2783_01100 [Microgenomates group bacterium RIFCSPHIGHO2_01_FULL_45_11]|nr:MAG: hypothetical protein A2783_01100 [Microgenomates group bacterium RIFCSPHIGHO2_01_FULL_45_11]